MAAESWSAGAWGLAGEMAIGTEGDMGRVMEVSFVVVAQLYKFMGRHCSYTLKR